MKKLINKSLAAALVLLAAGGNAIASVEPNASNCLGYASLSSGDPEQELGVGRVMLHGFMCPRTPARAAQLFESAAKKGNVEAMVELASMLSTGEFVPKDLKRSHDLFKRAADAGHLKGKSGLGWMLVFGDPAYRNLKKGMALLLESARGGDIIGQRFYALALVEEKVTNPPKFQEAAGWFRRAAEQNDGESARLLELLLDTGRVTVEEDDDVWKVIERAKAAAAMFGGKGGAK